MAKKDLTCHKFYLIFFLLYCDWRIFLNFVLRSLSDRPKTKNAVVAQLVEHRLPKPRVTGSSPAYRSGLDEQQLKLLCVFFVDVRLNKFTHLSLKTKPIECL